MRGFQLNVTIQVPVDKKKVHPSRNFTQRFNSGFFSRLLHKEFPCE